MTKKKIYNMLIIAMLSFSIFNISISIAAEIPSDTLLENIIEENSDSNDKEVDKGYVQEKITFLAHDSLNIKSYFIANTNYFYLEVNNLFRPPIFS